jgi:hypothetical protein
MMSFNSICDFIECRINQIEVKGVHRPERPCYMACKAFVEVASSMTTSSTTQHRSRHASCRRWGRRASAIQDTVASIHQQRDTLKNWILRIAIGDHHEEVLETCDIMRHNLGNMFANFFLLSESQYYGCSKLWDFVLTIS